MKIWFIALMIGQAFAKAGRDVEQDGTPVADIVADWLRRHDPVKLELDGRITTTP